MFFEVCGSPGPGPVFLYIYIYTHIHILLEMETPRRCYSLSYENTHGNSTMN